MGIDSTTTVTTVRQHAVPSSSLYRAASRHREVLQAAADAATWATCLAGTTLLRYDLSPRIALTDRLAGIVGIAVVLQLVSGWVTELYRSQWRVGSFEQVLALARTVGTVTVVVTAVALIPSQHVVPVSATVGAGALTMVVSAAGRSLWRLSWERQQVPTAPTQRAIIFGAGDSGRQLLDSLVGDPSSPFLPVAVLDDDPAKRSLRLRRLKVAGTREDLAEVAARARAQTLIIAVRGADSPLIRDLSDRAIASGLTVKVIPPGPTVDTEVTTHDVRPVTDADLLGRRVIDTGVHLVAGYLTGKRVLVTGAGGSIGSELCRQIETHRPERLVMLDRDESGLHAVQLSIDGRALLDDRALVVCDIRDPEALRAAFTEHRPEVVFHAAALKHLPLLEMWPGEAVKTNLLGTANVLACAADVGVQKFVNISTDKAANPCSVLGQTKRLAERFTADAGTWADGRYLSVRFGNVLGSRGSVLTTFRSQIASGGPVTVTHPDVRRYFMTVEEAVGLVIQAGAVGRNGEVLVLDMGEPVRIAEVAERMVAASGRSIQIVYTGLRPGEKLLEQLWDDHEVDERPIHPLISHVQVSALAPGEVSAELVGDPVDLRAALDRLCQRPDARVPSVGP